MFYCFEDELDKLKITKWVNVQTILNNLKTEENDLDGCKLKAAPVELKILWIMKLLKIQNSLHERQSKQFRKENC